MIGALAHPAKRARIAFLTTLFLVGTLGASCAIGVGEEASENRRGGIDKPDPPPDLTGWTVGPDTVLDRDNGLVWQRVAAPERLAYHDALAYCGALPLDGGGWRLPTRDELLTVLHHRQDPFGASVDWYGSSSAGVRPDTAWAVGINSWMNGNPIESKSRIRCVKSVATPRTPS